jgi:drug/metabolite transporter (DMT)-like permease
MLIIGAMSFVGQVFIYRLVKQFKQHIVPFIITTRKILTVVVSISYFGHKYTIEQVLGIVLVLGASAFEFLSEIRKDFKGDRVEGKVAGQLGSKAE